MAGRKKGRGDKVTVGRVLVGEAALDVAKSIAHDPDIVGKPENRDSIQQLLACIARAEAKDKP
jgi:hypothetical protein